MRGSDAGPLCTRLGDAYVEETAVLSTNKFGCNMEKMTKDHHLESVDHSLA